MTRAPDWSPEEFEILLDKYDHSPSELMRLLPRRAEGAIEVVRNGIHEFHQKGESSLLSEMMKVQITKKSQTLSCAICMMRF